MTAAERQQRKRDRLKAGLVRIELWVPADAAEAVKQAFANAVKSAEQNGTETETPETRLETPLAPDQAGG